MPHAVTSSKKCAARRACKALSSTRRTFHPSPTPRQPWADPPLVTALRHGPTRPAHPAWSRAAIQRRQDMRLRPSAKECSRKASTKLACHIPARRETDSPRSYLDKGTEKDTGETHMYSTTTGEYVLPKVGDRNAAGWALIRHRLISGFDAAWLAGYSRASFRLIFSFSNSKSSMGYGQGCCKKLCSLRP